MAGSGASSAFGWFSSYAAKAKDNMTQFAEEVGKGQAGGVFAGAGGQVISPEAFMAPEVPQE